MRTGQYIGHFTSTAATISLYQESHSYMGAVLIGLLVGGNRGENGAAQLESQIHKGGTIKARVKTEQLP